MRRLYYILQTQLRGHTSSFVKLLSLTLGLTVGVLLFSQIAYELNYDRCYPEADRLAIVRVKMTNTADKHTAYTGYDYTVYDAVAPTLAQDMAQWVESGTTVYPSDDKPVFYERRRLEGAQYLMVDTCFFRTMGIEVLRGNPQDLIRSDAAFVSESFARKTFGSDTDPVGKLLELDKRDTLTVCGVYRDMPHNSLLRHDFLASIHRNGGYYNGSGWAWNDMFYAILRLRNTADVTAVNSNLQRTVQQYTDTERDGWKYEYSVLPLPQKHTDDPDTRQRLLILGVLGFVIFFVSAMNYILVTIASLGNRAKAVGVHKCSGAGQGSIFAMSLVETGLFILVAAVLSVVLIGLCSDLVSEVLGVELRELFTWQTLWVPLLTVVLLLLVAGVLPGRMFARIPVTQLFRRYTDGKRGWKSTLLAVQFAGVSFVLGLLVFTILQYSLLMGRDMGIRLPGLVEAEGRLDYRKLENIYDYMRRQPYVEDVTMSTSSVLWQYWTQGLYANNGDRLCTLNFNYVHYNYPDVMGIEIVEGRTMQKKFDLLVNEEVVRRMKWTDGAVGKRLNNVPDEWGTIVGVFRDVRNEGFESPQQAIVLVANPYANLVSEVRLKPPYDDNLHRLNAFVEETFPDVYLHFVPLADKVRDMYSNVSRFRNAVWLTSAFIMLIVLVGLIGYVGDETRRRSKEIAIRKVNGACVADILRLLMRGILRVAVPTVLAGTVAAWLVGRVWLGQFVEQAVVSPLWLVLLALLLLALVVAVVVLKAWRIANENPVLSIKSE